MPLTPRLVLLCYDHNVYSVRRTGRVVETKLARDVAAYNELQYLNALENVYFGDWAQKTGIEARAARLKERRSESRTHFTRFEEDGCSSDGMQRSRRMAPGERMERDSMIIGASPVHVFPEELLSKVRFRRKMKYVSDRSGGYWRPATAMLRPSRS